MTPLFVDVREACRLLGIGKTSLYVLLNNQTLTSVTLGRKRLILLASIQRLVEGDSGEDGGQR